MLIYLSHSLFQWYEDYGEPEWKSIVNSYVRDPQQFNAYSARCLNQLVHVVGWLRDWACSRHYGLGTSLPWDRQILIESLSDSTIYMAFYTVAHLLQGDFYGDSPGLLGVKPEELTDAVFDFVFMQTDEFPAETSITKEKLNVRVNEL